MVIHVHGKDELVVQFRVAAPFRKQPLVKEVFYFVHKRSLSSRFMKMHVFPTAHKNFIETLDLKLSLTSIMKTVRAETAYLLISAIHVGSLLTRKKKEG